VRENDPAVASQLTVLLEIGFPTLSVRVTVKMVVSPEVSTKLSGEIVMISWIFSVGATFSWIFGFTVPEAETVEPPYSESPAKEAVIVTLVSERTSGAEKVTIVWPFASVVVLTEVWAETDAVERLPAFVLQEMVLLASLLPESSVRMAVRVVVCPEVRENVDGETVRAVEILEVGGAETVIVSDVLVWAPSSSVTVRVTV